MLFVFDIDDTSVTGYMKSPGKDYHKWEVLPGRKEKFAQLLANGHIVAFASNQAGVAMGHITEKVVQDRLVQILDALGLPPDTAVNVCYCHARARKYKYRDPEGVKRRKPSGAMIREHIEAFPEAAADGVIYIGDRPEDQAAARDAGVQFQWEYQFFAPENAAEKEEDN